MTANLGDENQALSYADIESEIVALDPNLPKDDPGFKVAALLLSSAVVGTDPFVLAAFTGEHVEWIAQVGARWEANGIWSADGEVAAGDWVEDGGGVTFWLHVNVGQGYLELDSRGFSTPEQEQP